MKKAMFLLVILAIASVLFTGCSSDNGHDQIVRSGNQTNVCTMCGGNGKCSYPYCYNGKCTNCNGLGGTICKGHYCSNGVCSTCWGAGTVQSLQFTGSTSKIVNQKCTSCHGTGYCPVCKGNGMFQCTKCYGAGYCPICYGSSTCVVCKGSGRNNK